jgi:hypothetical protein
LSFIGAPFIRLNGSSTEKGVVADLVRPACVRRVPKGRRVKGPQAIGMIAKTARAAAMACPRDTFGVD